MHSKERVYRAIKYQSVDRIPAGLFGTAPDYEQRLAEYCGLSSREALYRQLAIDVWHNSASGLTYRGPALSYRGNPVDVIHDFYWEHNPNPPFADVRSVDEVLEYPLPSPDDYDGTALEQEIRQHEDFALCTGINAAIFHNFLYLCGQENGFCLMKTEPDIAMAIIQRITDFWAAYLKRHLEIADGRSLLIENCNDFGTQNSLFISREDFCTFFKPQLKRLCQITHEHGVLYMQHSCGSVSPLLDDYVEIGVDILNPIQVSAADMNLSGIVSRYKGKLAFYGGIDTQYLLPQGPVSLIRQTVSEAVSLFGLQGGFILSGSQGLMDDIPLDHALAMLDPELRAM